MISRYLIFHVPISGLVCQKQFRTTHSRLEFLTNNSKFLWQCEIQNIQGWNSIWHCHYARLVGLEVERRPSKRDRENRFQFWTLWPFLFHLSFLTTKKRLDIDYYHLLWLWKEIKINLSYYLEYSQSWYNFKFHFSFYQRHQRHHILTLTYS